MKIVELNNIQFDEFAKFHPLNSYCQNSKYALVMSDYGYNYDYIGLVDDSNTVKAASLILTKKLSGNLKYGYAPKGFLVNYYDPMILEAFLNGLKEYYKDRGYVFIKFNPEIIIGETDKKRNYVLSYNGNVRIIDNLKTYNVKRRVELKEFDLMLPKFNAYINLKKFNVSQIHRSHRKKLKKAFERGMSLVVGDVKQMDVLYKFLKNKTSKPITFFRNIYNIYDKDNAINLVFVNIDYQVYLTNVKDRYEKEIIKNEQINEQIKNNPQSKTIAKKIVSDKIVQAYKNEIIYATNCLKKGQNKIVAGALIMKHANRISIIASGYDEDYKRMNPNQFLYYSIIEKYKEYFNFCDMNGVTGTFDETSAYQGLNDFKLKWNPTIYEFIGEFDLICNDHLFKKLIKTSFIEDEFSKQKY